MRRFERRDWLNAVVLFVTAIVCYAATRTREPYLWDSVEFALGITNYTVMLSQPHAPGYFLYVMLGRLVNVFVRDPHASLVWMSVVSGAGLIGTMYLLGTAMFGRVTGWVAALMMMTSPMGWFYSSVALMYVVDALLVTVLVLLCWRARERGVPWGVVWMIAGLLSVIGGVRQQSVPGLLLLVVFTLWSCREQRVAKIIVAGMFCTGLTGIWVATMLRMIGGWEAYWRPLELGRQFYVRLMYVGGGGSAVAWNVCFSSLFCFGGLLFGTAALATGVLGYISSRRRRARKYPFSAPISARETLILWIVPVFLVGTFLTFTAAPGHVFTYLPGLVLLAASLIEQVSKRLWRVALVAITLLVNLFVFFAWPPSWDRVLWGTLRTCRELRDHDQQLCNCVRVVREQFRPSETILCHWYGDLFFGLRVFQFCLPEFENVRIDPDRAMVKPPGRDLMLVHGLETRFVSQIDFSQYKQVVFVVPSEMVAAELEKYGNLGSRAKRIDLGKINLYVVPGRDVSLRGGYESQ